jgi:REP element-mobilizing transposase RayT
MNQYSFFKKTRGEHGGMHALGRRRSRRPLNIKNPVHLTFRSDLAKGRRSLLKHRDKIDRILRKFSRRFEVRVYEKAICGNHIHLCVKASTRRDLQFFFRVVAGQIAQEILREFPLQRHESKAFVSLPGGTPYHWKNQRTFWSLLAWTRIVAWGRDFRAVCRYVVQNAKEALGLIPYKKRVQSWKREGAVPPSKKERRKRWRGNTS